MNMRLDDFPEHGDARFADRDDLKQGAFYKSGGVYIGHDPQANKPIFFNGEGHILTIAPPGFGKTTQLIIPNLLTYDHGSMVVTDPKGVLTAVTKRQREAFGNRIVVLNPWRDEIAVESENSVGIDLGDCGYNPLRELTPDNPSLLDEAENLLSIIQPIAPSANGTEKFFAETSQSILIGAALYLAYMEGGVTLPRLYSFVRKSKQEWADVAADMADMARFGLDTYAAEILANLEGKNQWSGVQGSLNQATRIYNPAKPLGRHMMRDEFNPDDLKREKITVYLVIPSNRRAPNAPWLGLVLSSIAQSVGKPSKSAPVMLVAEEFANLGYLPSIPQAMAEYREAGLKVHLIVQSRTQLNRVYSVEGASELTSLCNVRQYFGVSELDLARAISESVGSYTAFKTTDGNPPRVVGKIKAPLARTEEILNMPEDEQIILTTGGTPPIHARLVGYWKNPRIARLADGNPMREGDTGGAERPLWGRLIDQASDGLNRLSGRLGARMPDWSRPALRLLGRGANWLQAESAFWLRSQVSRPATFTKHETLTREESKGGWSPWVVWLFWGFVIVVIVDIWGN